MDKGKSTIMYLTFKIIYIFCITAAGFSQSIDSTLHKAYKHNSKILLDEFFINWQKSNKLNDNEKLKIEEKINSDDTLKEIFEISKKYYNSIQYKSLIIRNDTFKYDVCNDDSVLLCYDRPNPIFGSHKIAPFRPESVDKEVFYLNSKYLNSFFDFFYYPSENWEILEQNYSQKADFLTEYIPFPKKVMFFKPTHFHLHYLLTTPKIDYIMINKSLNEAVVMIETSGFFVSTTLWYKVDNNWKYIKTIAEAGP